MLGVVPAAGAGTRMRPLTADRPKGLVEIDGRPLLAYVFDTLVDCDIERAVVVVGYAGQQIVEHFGPAYSDLSLQYVHQPERRGLADAVWQARAYVDERFLVLNGDNVFLDPIPVRKHLAGADGALVVESAGPASVAEGGEVRTAGDRITQVIEKPDEPVANLRTTGCYVLPAEAMAACGRVPPSDRGECELADAINRLIDRGYRFVPVRYDGWRRNVNTPADIDAVEARLD